IGILHCVGAASSPPPPQPHLGHAAGGAESRGRGAPGTVTVPLCSRTNASPFWIMLLLVWSRLDNGMTIWLIPYPWHSRGEWRSRPQHQNRTHAPQQTHLYSITDDP